MFKAPLNFEASETNYADTRIAFIIGMLLRGQHSATGIIPGWYSTILEIRN